MSWLLFAQLLALMFFGALFANTVVNNIRTHDAKEEIKVQQHQYDLDRQFYKETGEMRG